MPVPHPNSGSRQRFAGEPLLLQQRGYLLYPDIPALNSQNVIAILQVKMNVTVREMSQQIPHNFFRLRRLPDVGFEYFNHYMQAIYFLV